MPLEFPLVSQINLTDASGAQCRGAAVCVRSASRVRPHARPNHPPPLLLRSSVVTVRWRSEGEIAPRNPIEVFSGQKVQ